MRLMLPLAVSFKICSLFLEMRLLQGSQVQGP